MPNVRSYNICDAWAPGCGLTSECETRAEQNAGSLAGSRCTAGPRARDYAWLSELTLP